MLQTVDHEVGGIIGTHDFTYLGAPGAFLNLAANFLEAAFFFFVKAVVVSSLLFEFISALHIVAPPTRQSFESLQSNLVFSVRWDCSGIGVYDRGTRQEG